MINIRKLVNARIKIKKIICNTMTLFLAEILKKILNLTHKNV